MFATLPRSVVAGQKFFERHAVCKGQFPNKEVSIHHLAAAGVRVYTPDNGPFPSQKDIDAYCQTHTANDVCAKFRRRGKGALGLKRVTVDHHPLSGVQSATGDSDPYVVCFRVFPYDI